VVMTSQRRARERAQRKEEILQAARAAFAETGYRRTTVEAVAERAEIGKGTIYLYFESKEAIQAELLLEALAELQTQLEAAGSDPAIHRPDQKLRALAAAYLDFAHNTPDYFRLLNAYDHGDFEQGTSAQQQERLLEASNSTLDIVTQVIADGMASGIFAQDDPRKMAAVLWGAMNGALGLLAHPIRRNMLPGTDGHALCLATVDLLLQGLMDQK
jgi:AcrR family transcriptional regulator